ncbi:hypothetical protein KY331_05365 [Candidatus Woesearchaeota archaeon]|nr:hypothetical protein [Candidatus Woesearchaeota archaeon]
MKKAIFTIIILSIILVGCRSLSPEEVSHNNAKQIAKDFFYFLSTKNYDLVYDSLIPDLQVQRNKSEFMTFIQTAQSDNSLNFVYKYIVLKNENLAYAHYSIYDETGLELQNSTLELNRIDGAWKINGMEKYITSSCIIDDCAAELTPVLIKSFIERCLDTGHNYDQCKYLAERDYENMDFRCDKSTGYRCYAAE